MRKVFCSGVCAKPHLSLMASLSFVTFSIYMSRRPANELDFAIYKKPLIFDAREGEFVSKGSSSSVWPTALSMEELTWTITYLVDECRYVTLKVRNPHVYSQIWFRHT